MSFWGKIKKGKRNKENVREKTKDKEQNEVK
jgi:hypothetical protein